MVVSALLFCGQEADSKPKGIRFDSWSNFGCPHYVGFYFKHMVPFILTLSYLSITVGLLFRNLPGNVPTFYQFMVQPDHQLLEKVFTLVCWHFFPTIFSETLNQIFNSLVVKRLYVAKMNPNVWLYWYFQRQRNYYFRFFKKSYFQKLEYGLIMEDQSI